MFLREADKKTNLVGFTEGGEDKMYHSPGSTRVFDYSLAATHLMGAWLMKLENSDFSSLN